MKNFTGGNGIGLSGGLIFKGNEEVKFAPGCCCGLDDWAQWLDVPNGETNIRNGHDPFCSVEVEGGIIKVRPDDRSKVENPAIEFSVEEFAEKIHIKV